MAIYLQNWMKECNGISRNKRGMVAYARNPAFGSLTGRLWIQGQYGLSKNCGTITKSVLHVIEIQNERKEENIWNYNPEDFLKSMADTKL